MKKIFAVVVLFFAFTNNGSAQETKQKDPNVKTLIVPGSQAVAKQIIAEGLDKIFAAAGVEIRQAGCSACLGMNEDKIPAGEYCISTSNRNFEGRQGAGGARSGGGRGRGRSGGDGHLGVDA